MSDDGQRPGDGWGDEMAKKTFIGTLVLAILYVGAVFLYAMR